MKLASGTPVNISQAVKITFDITNHEFTDTFVVLPTMNCYYWKPLFQEFELYLPRLQPLKLPILIVQLSEIKPKGKAKIYLKNLIFS